MNWRYLLDTNIFIQAKNLHYGFDFCPAFWDWLIIQSNNGVVGSLGSVREELLEGKDDLSEWVRNKGKNLFVDIDESATQKFPNVQDWLSGQNYEDAKIRDFSYVADFQLVACALAHGCTVVTHEAFEGGATKKVKIPDVCEGLGINYILPYKMLRSEQARFVLGEVNP